MNELIFLLHMLIVFVATVAAFFCGRHALQAAACLYVVIANIFGIKRMLLCGLAASGGDVYIVGSMCALLMGTAVWGNDFAKRTAVLSAGMSLFTCVLAWFQLAYVPALADTAHGGFVVALGRMSSITFFSIAAHYVAQLLTVGMSLLFSRLWCGRLVFVRSAIAMVVGQLVDAVIFFVGVFGRDLPLCAIAEMVAVSTAIKLVLSVSGSALVSLAVWCKERGYVQ